MLVELLDNLYVVFIMVVGVEVGEIEVAVVEHHLKAPKINIRYELVFQIEKNFCPDFLLFIT